MTSKVREKGERVRAFLLEGIGANQADIVPATMSKFDITRQAVNKHIHRLRDQGTVSIEGGARNPQYKLCAISEKHFSYLRIPGMDEDQVWRNDVRPNIEPLPDNVLRIWHYAFTEIFNNAIDHSSATRIRVAIRKTALTTYIAVDDDGIGIFKKIQGELDLVDERQAIFELSKGKLTTDPKNHSGQGIFFTSRMMDEFSILSGGLYFDHDRREKVDWLLENSQGAKGTFVQMLLSNHTSRTSKKVFDEFSSGDDYAFNKTIVPLDLAKFGADELISRSQAKRVLARVNLFKFVIFDFTDVQEIGQGFADQIFRVYANDHPNIELIPTNANDQIMAMINRAKSGTAQS